MINKINFLEDKKEIESEFERIGEELQGNGEYNGNRYWTAEQDQYFNPKKALELCGLIRVRNTQFRLIIDCDKKIRLWSRENVNDKFINNNEVIYVIRSNEEAYKVEKNSELENEEFRKIKWSKIDYRKILINLMNKSFKLQKMNDRIKY